MAAGADDGLEPVGLGARDTLRLEAALPLYGHELDDTTSPLAAGLARFVKLDGDDFIGKSYLVHEQAQGAPRRLVGLAVRGPGIARQGYPVTYEGAQVGVVTSGTHAPTLGSAIALAYVSAPLASLGTLLTVEVRGRGVPVEVVPTPFYRRMRPPAAPARGAEPAPEATATERIERAEAAPPPAAADESTESTTEPVAPIELNVPADEEQAADAASDDAPTSPEGEH
jgi:hypothetical protein